MCRRTSRYKYRYRNPPRLPLPRPGLAARALRIPPSPGTTAPRSGCADSSSCILRRTASAFSPASWCKRRVKARDSMNTTRCYIPQRGEICQELRSGAGGACLGLQNDVAWPTCPDPVGIIAGGVYPDPVGASVVHLTFPLSCFRTLSSQDSPLSRPASLSLNFNLQTCNLQRFNVLRLHSNDI